MTTRSDRQTPLPTSRSTSALSEAQPVRARLQLGPARVAKSALRKILTLIGGALIALAGAWLIFVGGPPVGSSLLTDSGRQPDATLITARAISEPTFGYNTPSVHGRIKAEYTGGESLTFTGYCIGAPVLSVEASGTDERWLIRPNGILVPAGSLARYSTQVLPVPCPGQKTLKEPQVLAPYAQPTMHGTLLHLTLAHASIVGFALYRPQNKSWEQVAKRIVSGGPLTVQIAARRHVAVVIAACWANGIPALRPTPGNYVARVIGLPGTSGEVTGNANAATPQGALQACGPLPTNVSGKAPSPKGHEAKSGKPARQHSGANAGSRSNAPVMTVPTETPLPTEPPNTTQQSGSEELPPGAERGPPRRTGAANGS